MAKKPTPAITHTETLCLALRCLERDIDDMRKRCEGVPGAESVLQHFIDQRSPKLEALKAMYRIETGTEFD